MKVYDGNRKNAFTLAEVLITLGIVGVVAAMTIPALIASYQRNVWESKLKKVYSIATNACERMLTTEGVSAAEDTDIYANLPNSVSNAQIKKYFKIIKDGASESKGFSVYLPDGAVIYLNKYDTAQAKGLNFWVDVNGNTKPNKAGRDQFEFKLDKNCSYYDHGGYATVQETAFKKLVKNHWKIDTTGD